MLNKQLPLTSGSVTELRAGRNWSPDGFALVGPTLAIALEIDERVGGTRVLPRSRVRAALGALAEVKGLLGLRIAAGKPCDRVRERARGKLADIDRRIAELGAMRNALGRLVEKCQDASAPGACAFLDELAQPFDPG